jgi:hypothetical protein
MPRECARNRKTCSQQPRVSASVGAEPPAFSLALSSEPSDELASEFIPLGWHQSRRASGLRVVLYAEHQNAARNVPRQRHHTWDRGRRLAVLA